MGIAVLGPITWDGSASLSPRDRVVLAVLATRPGRPVAPDRIVDALWGDTPPATAGKVLQGCIARLRKVMGKDAIETSTQGYALTLPSDEIDSMQFERLVTRGRELLVLGEADRAAYLLTQALSLWRGEAFADVESWPPAADEARRLGELRLEAEELRVDAQLRAGRHDEVLAEAQALVRAAPLRERRWSLLALAQYQSGAQGEALRTIHQLKSVLARQLGIDAGHEAMALEQAILRQDTSLLSAPALAPSAGNCPWQGLKPYGEGDADRFFGRESDVDSCLEILRRTALLVLVGPSGCGKSSLLHAGVAATLRGRGRPTVSITPGTHPMQAITALGQARPDTVLLVDQFEELFSLCADVKERQEFLDALTAEAAARTVVLALRADHLADVASNPAFSRLVERGLYLVGGLDEQDLRQAIEGPARQAGLVIEPGLVDVLVGEVKDDPGALPLLSHALLETWKRREGNTLTVAGYQASGGIHDAVAQSAERLYARIEVEQRHLLRDLVLRLVSPGSQGEPVRSRVPRRLVANDAEHDQLIELLVGARLVTSDDGVLEITHEALARAWPRLRGWLDDDVEGQRMLHHLSSSADAWDSLGRPDSELYRGIRLARVLDWQRRGRTALTDTEREFLQLSRQAVEAEERTTAERARAQARLIRRLRIVLGGAAVLLVLALIAGAVAAVQSSRASRNAAEARDAAKTARQAAVSADARRVGARSQLTDDIGLSLLLAAAGARLDDSPETRVNLLTALAKRPNLVRSGPPGPFMESFDMSADGRWIASSDDQSRMHLYDASTDRLLRSYDASGPPAFMLAAFSPDSTQLAVVVQSESAEPVRLLDPTTMEPTTKLPFPGSKPVWGVNVGFSADGRYLAATVQTVNWYEEDTSVAPGYAVVWDLQSPSTPPVRVATGTDVQGVVLSPDGRTLYTSWPLTAYDVADGSQIWRREELSTPYGGALDINAEGTLLALQRQRPDGCGVGLLVRASNGATVRTLTGQWACEIRFSPDGSLVGSLYGGEMSVWETATGRLLERLRTFDPWGIGFSPDNDLVHTGGADSMLRTWDLSAEDTYLQRTTQVEDAEVFAEADIAPDGQQVAYRWLDDQGKGWVRFVDAATGERTRPTRLPAVVDIYSGGTWHPDGGRYVSYCTRLFYPCKGKGVVTVLDSTTGEVVRQRDGDKVWAAAYVDDGRSLLVGSFDKKSRLIDSDTLLPTGETFDFAADVATTPIGDGSTAMVYTNTGAGFTAHWRVIEVNTGEVLTEGGVDLGVNASVAAADGSTVAVAGKSGEIVTIDVSTGDELRRSTGLGGGVQVLWLDYSDDGELLVSGADDGGVSLWDASTLDLLGTVYPPHHGNAVPAGAQFIGDTHDVVIASYDGRVYRWETDLERAIDFACQMAGRDLTEKEWEAFLPAQPYQSVCPEE